MRDWLWASMVVGLVLTGVAGTSAQRGRGRSSDAETTAVVASPSGPRETEARALFEAGRQAFTDGRFEDALQRFSQSYELSHRAELLFNIGQAADRLRRDAEALAAFEADSGLCEALGPDLTRTYLALRRDELARWDSQGHAWSLDEVTPWELREYLPFY